MRGCAEDERILIYMNRHSSRFFAAYFVAIFSFALGASAISGPAFFSQGIPGDSHLAAVAQSLGFSDSSEAVGSYSPAAAASTPPPASLVFCHTFRTDLKQGQSGKEVGLLQSALEEAYLKVTGAERSSQNPFFGKATLAAVTRFQEKNSLPQTGFVGPQTRALLSALSHCPLKPVVQESDGKKREAGTLPSYDLADGKVVIFREKVTALTSTDLGVEMLSLRKQGVSLSAFQVFAYFSPSYSGSATFLSPVSIATSSVSFDLRSIALLPGQSRYLEFVAKVSVVDPVGAYLAVSRPGISDEVLLGKPFWILDSLELPDHMYPGTDFAISAILSSAGSGTSSERFKAEMFVQNSAGVVVYHYMQPYSGRSSLPFSGKDLVSFGTVIGGPDGAAMNFPSGTYSAKLVLSDPDIPARVLASSARDFSIGKNALEKAVLSDPLDAGTADSMLADLRDAIRSAAEESGRYGNPVSTCDAGIFANPSVSVVLKNIRGAEGSIVACRAAPDSFAISVQVPESADPICIDALGYDGPGKVTWSSSAVAYCLEKIPSSE